MHGCVSNGCPKLLNCSFDWLRLNLSLVLSAVVYTVTFLLATLYAADEAGPDFSCERAGMEMNENATKNADIFFIVIFLEQSSKEISTICLNVHAKIVDVSYTHRYEMPHRSQIRCFNFVGLQQVATGLCVFYV